MNIPLIFFYVQRIALKNKVIKIVANTKVLQAVEGRMKLRGVCVKTFEIHA